MRKKKIMCAKYNSEFRDSNLNYEQELKSARYIIKIILETRPTLTDDEAYLLFRNSTGGVNTYAIHEEDDE